MHPRGRRVEFGRPFWRPAPCAASAPCTNARHSAVPRPCAAHEWEHKRRRNWGTPARWIGAKPRCNRVIGRYTRLREAGAECRSTLTPTWPGSAGSSGCARAVAAGRSRFFKNAVKNTPGIRSCSNLTAAKFGLPRNKAHGLSMSVGPLPGGGIYAAERSDDADRWSCFMAAPVACAAAQADAMGQPPPGRTQGC